MRSDILRRTRPILSQQDYEAVITLLRSGMASDHSERLDALSREISDYEARGGHDAAYLAGWSECVFVPSLFEAPGPGRRRSDAYLKASSVAVDNKGFRGPLWRRA